ncbi:MAG TPA: (2Fe-2S) ferredoxin domain-containing protein [Candidatus Hydrogenedentes bacterium]|jgi:NADH:ubiquinone oxidoreductase subunit E|nr:MAG: Respiratory-chain NADH dehydrogenase 24 Kd subunit [Candidatus Hydrogenedentes bacterium ADurb.Bin101]HOC68944.1 (2Fe-2S) ferredoxin domain-containing protein [Candidatus Hydrogenedentota bacterium]HQM99994.1 (2Fe-2S) ferredoxin domain-containing protein [Candidatus Hydrogenedentota bacterium]
MGDQKHDKVKIKVCVGSHCKDKKSKKIARRLEDWVLAFGLEDKMRVTRCDCLKRCKEAAVVVVPARDLVFEKAKPGDAEKIVKAVSE